MGLSDIEPRQKPPELFARDRLCFVRSPRPPEPIEFQFFVPQTISIFVPVKNLHRIPLPSAEHKILPAHRIKLELVRDQVRQSVNRLPHVGLPENEPDTRLFLKPQHGRRSR